MNSFEVNILVGPEDIDDLGHVNNVVYLRWMQQAATAHWECVADAATRAAVHWVVIRHEIDYKAQAFAGEQLVVRTRVGEATAATWERHTEVRRVSDDKLLAQCRSVYVALDPVTARPRRIDASLRTPFGR
ncbi:MAG TPA: acyl-CoA thioesterase [Gemmatimonadales bacterium]|jgi:acyl-CoA thioester hydrolase|nr:acyl-CoA thioesterase [Gemmatimonadales bacterium]